MRKSLFTMIIAIVAAFAGPGVATAGPDRFAGDTVIYGGSASVLQPNVLLIIDNSGSMNGLILGGSYISTMTYTVTNNCSGNCSKNAVYKTTDGGSSGTLLNSSINNITTSCNSKNPRSLLQTFGIYSGRRLNSSGTCAGSGSAVYVLGNYINWYHSSTGWKEKIAVARDVVKNLVNTTNGVKFGLMKYRSDTQGAQFMNATVSGSTYQTTIKDMDLMHTGTVSNSDALVAVVGTLSASGNTPLGESLVEALRAFQGNASDFGNTIGLSGSPLEYTSPIDFGCQKNYIVFVTDGMSTADGSSKLDFIQTKYTRYDGGNCSYTTCANDRSHSLAGAARYLYETDLRTDITGTQNVITYTIGFGLGGADQEAIDLLKLAADNKHGRGQYFDAGSEAQLSKALTTIIQSIFVTDSSFVAPVVPVSPENRTFSGSRLYMGFFRPEAGAVWSGNLKKYALQDQLASVKYCGANQDEVLDVTGHCATYDDGVGDINIGQARPDSRDGVTIPANVASGTFRPGSQSYWSAVPDAGEVKEGGAGELLLNRSMTISCATCDISGAVSDTGKRKIYTYLETNIDLTNSSNDFSTLNSALTSTPGKFGLPGPIIATGTTNDVKMLINFIHGFDTYGLNSAGTTTTKREWILGDVLHSKPMFVSYATFTVTASDEADCTKNKSYVFFGSNDGMLHAFKDCDGSEAWAFIPPDVLPTLQYLQGPTHAYFADSTIKAYVFDRNNDGTIVPTDGDTVILVFGLRRGSGKDSQPTQGLYYALDVSNPTQPKFLWSMGNNKKLIGITNTASTAFGDLGESWSEPKIGKIKLGAVEKIVAFFGGGYDNCNEDSRFGSTQTFSGACGAVASSDGGLDAGGLPITSSGATVVTTLNSAQYKGRAFYVVELASFSSSTTFLDLTNKGALLWSYTQAGSPPLEFSMLSEPAAIDMNFDGYVDRIYMGDTGGNMWRFDISSFDKNNWNVKKIFSSNPGFTGYPPPGTADGTNGRKILYNPSVVVDKNFVRIYFGTGDREHPLNRAVVDRFYEVIDKGNIASALTEVKLVDVSTDLIQLGTAAQIADFENKINQVEDKDNTTYYGWYVRMEGFEHLANDQLFSAATLTVALYQGEKVISNPRVFDDIVYFTTFIPNTDEAVDPCNQGNTGQSFLWALDSKNGRSILNFNATNDSTSNYNTVKWNAYASKGKSGDKVYQRTDRAKRLGTGMASPPGEHMGCSGSLCPSSPDLSGHVLQIYWRQK